MASKAVLPQTGPSKTNAVNSGSPNQTLYVTNLNEKINKNELKRALYMLFSTFGPVLDIVTARKGAKGQNMRGQAHIVYRDIQTSTQAMRALQEFDLFGKELKIVYGRGQSQIFPKLRGTFEPSASAAVASESTDLQKSIFNAPPSGIPPKPMENGISGGAAALPEQVAGTKRPRDEEESEEEDAPMEEDDDDASMEEDDDD